MQTKQLWPTVAGILGMLGTLFVGPISTWVTANPEIAIGIYTVLNAIANLVHSPLTTEKAQG
jgi:hypothetical protein